LVSPDTMISPVKIKLEFFDLCYRVVVILVLILVVEVMICIKQSNRFIKYFLWENVIGWEQNNL
jgi:hypothetical protein